MPLKFMQKLMTVNFIKDLGKIKKDHISLVTMGNVASQFFYRNVGLLAGISKRFNSNGQDTRRKAFYSFVKRTCIQKIRLSLLILTNRAGVVLFIYII